MTQLRSKIVSRQSLNALAVNLGLDVHVISNGGTGITQKHIYGDAFEAMMGAVYLDQGYEFVNRLLINNIYFRFLNLGERFQEPPDRVEPEEPPPGRVPHGARQGIRFEPSGFLLHGAGRRHGGRPRSRGFEEGGRTACGVLRVAVHERRAVRFAAGQGRPSGRYPFRKRVLEGGGNPLHFRSCSAPARQMGIRTRFQTPSAGGCTGLPG